jgi:hypothetical protein
MPCSRSLHDVDDFRAQIAQIPPASREKTAHSLTAYPFHDTSLGKVFIADFTALMLMESLAHREMLL